MLVIKNESTITHVDNLPNYFSSGYNGSYNAFYTKAFLTSYNPLEKYFTNGFYFFPTLLIAKNHQFSYSVTQTYFKLVPSFISLYYHLKVGVLINLVSSFSQPLVMEVIHVRSLEFNLPTMYKCLS